MTAILGADGKLVFSREVRETGVLEQGARFDVTVFANGDILLKRVRAHQKPPVEPSPVGEGLKLQQNQDLLGKPIQS